MRFHTKIFPTSNSGLWMILIATESKITIAKTKARLQLKKYGGYYYQELIGQEYQLKEKK